MQPVLQKKVLEIAILEKLIEANLVYQADISPEELRTLANVFADDLLVENPESVTAAFDMHRRRSTRFPTPAHIFALLPECRVMPKLEALPQTSTGKKTAGAGRLAFAAFKGDKQAKEALSRLVGATAKASTA